MTAEITYRRGKLAAVDVKKGTFDFELLGLVVPAMERHVDPKSMLPVETKAQKNAFYSPALEGWHAFFRNKTGIDYRMTAADGIALCQIGDHLKALGEGDVEVALSLWATLLSRWDVLEPFYRNSLDLKFINSQLNKILIQIKHGKRGIAAGGVADDADDLRRGFAH